MCFLDSTLVFKLTVTKNMYLICTAAQEMFLFCAQCLCSCHNVHSCQREDIDSTERLHANETCSCSLRARAYKLINNTGQSINSEVAAKEHPRSTRNAEAA